MNSPDHKIGEIVIITGPSGSGKSTVKRALEDLGFYTVDNLPLPLCRELFAHNIAWDIPRIALILDIRAIGFSQNIEKLIKHVRSSHTPSTLVYLHANNDVLLRRYSQTRRPHPLDTGAGLRAAMLSEQAQLAPLQELADQSINTSDLSPHQLRDNVSRLVSEPFPGESMRIELVSFGYKYGLPSMANLVFDVRYLPNPFFEESLRAKTGLDQEVFDYVMNCSESHETTRRITDMVKYTIPQFMKEGKHYMTVAIGCTGGQHRSVSITRQVKTELEGTYKHIHLRHKEISR